LTPHRVDAGEGPAYRVLDNVITVKLTAAETGNAFSLSEVWTPSGGGVPLHVEFFEEKTFYVLDGTYVVRIGDGTIVLGAGDLAFVPRNTPSAFRNASPLPASMLILATPGGIHERFHAEIGVPVSATTGTETAGIPTYPRMRDRAPSYGIAILEGWRSPTEILGS
jgi:quercetin dioxygenase-like cupin family protein